MTNYTPGKWTSEYGTRSSWVHLGDADDGRVVEVKGDNHQNDADFIAEAPAMLDAIKELLRGHQADIENYGPEDDVYRAHDAAHAIILRIAGGE